MKFTVNSSAAHVLPIGILFALSFCCCPCVAQTVSDNEQHHYHDYNPYNLGDSLKDSGMVRFLGVSASDGKMSRIDNASDPGSAWVGWMSGSDAYFQGYQNPDKTGYFNPQFSGEVTKTGGSGGTEPAKYEWTIHKAGYHIVRIQIDESIPAIIVKDDNQCQNDRGKIVFECTAKFMGHTSNLSPTIMQKTVTLSNTGVGKVKFGHTQNSLNSESLNITVVPYQTTKFYVAGSSPSSAMNDAEITASCDGKVVYKKDNLTVLWVDLHVNTGNVHSDNEQRNRFMSCSPDGSDKLGARWWRHFVQQNNGSWVLVNRYCYCFEVQGTVKPNGFTGALKLLRDAEVSKVVYIPIDSEEPIPGPTYPVFGDNYGEDANDISPNEWLDLTPSPPLIFDLDCPTPGNVEGAFSQEPNFKLMQLNRYREFAQFNSIRCSSVKEIQILFTITKDQNGNVHYNAQ